MVKCFDLRKKPNLLSGRRRKIGVCDDILVALENWQPGFLSKEDFEFKEVNKKGENHVYSERCKVS